MSKHNGAPKISPRSQQRSALAMVILSFLIEAPMHAYRMHELIKQRGKASVVNVAQRNSVYQTLERLLRTELIHVLETSQQDGRPERVIYEITATGRTTLHDWLTAMLAEPSSEFPEFPAALATIMVLSPQEAQAQLALRLSVLKRQLTQLADATDAMLEQGLPRLFLIEDEYKQALCKAEISWISSLIDDLSCGDEQRLSRFGRAA